MKNPKRAWAVRMLIPAALLLATVSAASAQTTPDTPSSRVPVKVSWQVDAIRDSVAIRDIARTGRPLDASPVEWKGDGPGLLVRYTRQRGRGLHDLEFSATRASHFVLKTPIESLTRSKDDALSRIDARYEYRRYLFSDVLVHGLDLGAALQGGGVRTKLTEHFDGDLHVSESRIAFRTALVASARYRTGSKFGLQVDWANGGHIDHSSERHSAAGATTITRSGGGWLTDLSAVVDVAISSHASIAIRYLSSDEALMSSHRNFTTARQSWTVGMIYAK